jgi:DNA-binding FadR family transcriptional regulator
VRLLERHQIAVMRRGPGGGLFVTRPGTSSAAGALALLLERRGIRPADLFELRVAVELTILELAVKRLDDRRAATLQRALDDERRASVDEYPDVGHDLHGVLAGLVDNPVLELLSLVLIRLTRRHQSGGPPTTTMSADTHRAHVAIVDAIVARDVELARHRMRRHLAAMSSFVH